MSQSHISPYFLNLKNIFCDNSNQCAYIKHFTYNEILYKQGDAPFNLYIFLSGRLQLLKEKKETMDCVAGEFIGAQANFANICYLETVKFFSPGEVFVIPFASFNAKMEEYPSLRKDIIECLTRKQKIVTNILDEKFSTYLKLAV